MGSGNALFPTLQSVINACIKCVHLPGPVPRIETSVRHGGLLVVGAGGGPVSDQNQDATSSVGTQGQPSVLPGEVGWASCRGDPAGEALAMSRCVLRPTSSSLLSWTCSSFCLFHTALP